MPILYNEQTRILKLDAGDSTYAMHISDAGYLFHIYYGGHISDTDLEHLEIHGGGASFSPSPADAPHLSLDTALQEYPTAGTGDFRRPCLGVMEENGASGARLQYVSHDILQGQKPALQGLPATYLNAPGEADTLAIHMEDKHLGLRVTLYYCVFTQSSVITRWAVLENGGAQDLELRSALSACVEFCESDFDMISLRGAWCRERSVERHPLFHGATALESRRGSTGHQLNSFAILCEKGATEDYGQAYGFQLVYSGNFLLEAEVSQMNSTRVSIGVNPYDFGWQLKPGDAFTTPEAVLTYSNEGLGGISRTLHRLYRKNLCRGEWRDKPRPILINNWEATFFKFNAEKLVAIAREAAKADIDMLVMDDGWFGQRYDDHRALGDWVLNEEKMGCSLGELVERVKAEGLRFGIWFEPEMISPDSDLYRAHPDWALHIPGRSLTLGRDQSVLNLTLPEVRAYLIDSIGKVLESAEISYVKWDFNRNLTEVFSAALPAAQSREVWHRYVLGLYEIMEALVQRFPHILFESCSGGGGRFDPAMLYYMPQTWCSDNTDAADRLKIQYGTSFCFPVVTMGAHVAVCHNGREIPLRFRAAVAMAGSFGYELDLTKLPPEQIAEMKEMNADFRAWQSVIDTGDFYRLRSPFEGEETAWMFVSEDKSEALVQYFRTRVTGNSWATRLTLRGLAPEALYSFKGKQLRGDTLMRGGLVLGGRNDFAHHEIWLQRVPE
ncbi:MAG: alpha-galactosidase [Oscillospiraceae bacterium]|jgi:alpha-galactosidase|nr:alpha-galactosidase [Oscillospiraceae bacterium]